MRQTSCCHEYQLVADGGQYFMLRRRDGRYEESARFAYDQAAQAYADLAANHECKRRAP